MGRCQGARGRKGGGGAVVFKRGGNKLWESVARILFFCEKEATSVQCGRAGMENEIGETPVLDGVIGLSWET